MSHRIAVLLARDEELSTPFYEGQEAVLACCNLFLAVANVDGVKSHIERTAHD